MYKRNTKKYTDYGLPHYRRKQRSKRKLLLFVFVFLFAVIGVFFYFQRNATRVLLSISEATMRASTTVAVNDAVYYTLSD